jgi:hypothetical protein
MPRHLNDADLPQITVQSSTEAPNLGTLLGSENFNSGTIGQDVESPNSFLTDAFPWGHITFQAGGYTGQKAYADATQDHYLEHSLGGSYPAWRDAGTVDVKFKVSSLPTNQHVRLGGFQNAPNEDYVFGIFTNGNIGIGYVNPNPATKTTYAVSPDEWVRVLFTYRNNYTITLRLFHGANINGTVPDETISRQGSYQNLRYLIFGRKDGWGNTNVAVSYDDLYLYHGVPTFPAPLPQRTGLQFAGSGISSMVDNPSTRSTDITVANNPSATEFEGGTQWEKIGVTLGTGGSALDVGAENFSDGSTTWFDAGASDLPNGTIYFAEQGLYSVGLHFSFNGDAPYTYDPEDLFSVMCRVYNADASHRYDVIRPVLQIKKIDGVSDQWGASITMTDVMEDGGHLLFYRTGSDQMRSRSGITYYTTIRKFV